MPALEPFEYLVHLAKKIKREAPTLPSQQEIVASWSGIGFSLLQQRLVAPMGEIVEMLEVPPVTRLPGVQPWVTGLANFRGRLIPLFDLEAFFGGKLSVNRARHRVLVLEMGELYAGLIVSEVFGMQHFPQDLDAVELSEIAQKLSPYSKGAYEINDLVWTTFSPFHLVRDPRFFNAAAA